MFEILKELSRGDVRQLVGLLDREVEPRLVRQERGYASGRRYAWLGWEPSFQEPPSALARPRGRLWSALQEWVPEIEAAECWCNGEGSSPGIRPHRDAPYADPVAYILNLGRTRFRIWLPTDCVPHPGLARIAAHTRFSEYAMELTGGELIRFDCKVLHASATEEVRRWGIGMWKFKASWKERAEFRSF